MPLLNKNKSITILTWSFFAFSLIQTVQLFISYFSDGLSYVLIASVLTGLCSFACARICRVHHYGHYLLLDLAFAIVIIVIAAVYQFLIRLDNEPIRIASYLIPLILGAVPGSALFLIIKQKKYEV